MQANVPMNCPRCDGAVETYTLEGREAKSCVRCGWVGINTNLQRHPEVSATGSLDTGDVETDISAESATVDRREPTTLPTEEPAPERTNDQTVSTSEAETTTSGTESDEPEGPPQPLLDIGTIEQSEAAELAATGIDTIDALATIEPAELSVELDLSLERLQTLSDQAAIHIVTNDASGE